MSVMSLPTLGFGAGGSYLDDVEGRTPILSIIESVTLISIAHYPGMQQTGVNAFLR